MLKKKPAMIKNCYEKMVGGTVTKTVELWLTCSYVLKLSTSIEALRVIASNYKYLSFTNILHKLVTTCFTPHMFIALGLPYDSEFNIDAVSEHNAGVKLVQIMLPQFTGVSLEKLVNQEEQLKNLCKQCNGLYKTFVKRFTSNADNVKLNVVSQNLSQIFSWSDEKYFVRTIGAGISLFREELKRINDVFLEKLSNLEICKREFYQMQKIMKGNLADIDITPLIDHRKDSFEFLKVVYVSVKNDRIQDFYKCVNDCEAINEDVIEKIACDDEYTLYKLFMLANDEDKIKKVLLNGSFKVKIPEKCIEDYESKNETWCIVTEAYKNETKNFNIFVTTYIFEVFSLLVHIKLLSLYVESVYRYGLPTEYLFFITNGEVEAIMEKCYKMVKGKSISDRLSFDDGGSEEKEEEYNAFAYVEIDTYEDE